MAKEKEYNKRTLVSPDGETPIHRKKSVTASKSNSNKRSDHRHDYEQVIIEHGSNRLEYYWAKRCKICGRVVDPGWYKPEATKGLVKEVQKINFKDGSVFKVKIFYAFSELKKLFPGVPILVAKPKGEYVEK